MIKKFKEHIASDFPELETKKVLVAVSGGVDSVTLLHLLHRIGYDVVAAHCNFNLRGKDADLDEEFVGKTGKKLQISTWVKSFDTKQYALQNKLSIQEAARKLRYDWFAELLAEKKADILVTAHNLDDNFETVLHHLTRGTGLQGLLGIPPKNDKIYRPLLAFSRSEIHDFAVKNNIAWREDKSNAETKYIRNKIRHKVLPVLQEINPNLLNSFKKTQHYLKQSNAILEEVVQQKWNAVSEIKNDIIQISIFKLSKLNQTDFYYYQFFKPFGFTDVSEIKKLIHAQSGKQLFSKTHRLLKDRNLLLLDALASYKKEVFEIQQKDTCLFLPNFQLMIEDNVDLSINPSGKDKKSVVIDKDLLKFPLTVRKWQKGDYFYPLGMQGKKKLSKFFKDNKLNLFEKESIWLLLSGNEIVWVIGMRQDRRFAVDAKTKNKIKFSVLNSEKS